MNWIDLISAVLGLSCVVLAGRRLVANFWVGYVYNIFLFVLFLYNGLYASMAIQLLAFAINGIGHWRWTHPDEKEKDADGSLAVTRLSSREYALYSLMVAAVFGVLFLLLRNTNDPQPVLDSVCTAMILLAQWLSAQKKLECWWVWLAVNIMNLILYLKAGLLFMPIVALLYLANGIWSLISWKKHEGNTENN